MPGANGENGGTLTKRNLATNGVVNEGLNPHDESY